MDIAQAERTYNAAANDDEQRREELAVAIADCSAELFEVSVSTNGDLQDALQEIAYSELDLLAVFMDDAALGKLLKGRMLAFMKREADKTAERML